MHRELSYGLIGRFELFDLRGVRADSVADVGEPEGRNRVLRIRECNAHFLELTRHQLIRDLCIFRLGSGHTPSADAPNFSVNVFELRHMLRLRGMRLSLFSPPNLT